MQEKLSEIARFRKGEPDEAEIAAAKDAQEKRNKKVGYVARGRIIDVLFFAFLLCFHFTIACRSLFVSCHMARFR